MVDLCELRACLVVVTDDFHVWDIWRADRIGILKHGQLVLLQDKLDKEDAWVVANMFITDNYRGHGYMRQLLAELLPYYGSFISDFKAAWSNDAVHMWEAMGAVRQNTSRCSMGFVYYLCSQNLVTSLKTPAKSDKATSAAAG